MIVRHRFATLVAPTLAAAALAGCTVGPNYRAPELPVPATYGEPVAAAQPGAPADPARWWDQFGDTELSALVTRALKDNPSVQIAGVRVREARLQEAIVYQREHLTIGTSLGIALYPDHGDDVESLMLAADLAMYESKASGGNGWRFASSPDKTPRGKYRPAA